ncbi:MAG: tryptophan--tRNA ligase, partial [Alphaproteobacteria bacterium]|nr:tryptophan--tRNA ligase [Alphaproteobacteria bacterium]
ITQWQEPAELAANTREVAATFLAAGIDPERQIIFNQSQVPAHAELAWIFNCVARLGWLNRMTQFKEKAGKHRENASAGLYVYPALMAADILLYKATHVPVGEDQKQHLELTRDVAQKFNNDFGREVFPIVEPLIFGAATRVMNLRDGSKKMSKSDPSDYSRINLNDGPDEIAQKIRKARTDPDPLPETVDGFEGRPEAENLVSIHAALSDQTPEAVLQEHAGQQFSTFKAALTEVAVAKLGPIGEEMQRLMAAPDHVEAILKAGAERAEAIAGPVLREVYETVGFLNVR